MYEAFTSAHVASASTRAVLEGREADLSAYPARLEAALGRHTSLAWIAKAAIERAPGVALRVAGSRAIRRQVPAGARRRAVIRSRARAPKPGVAPGRGTWRGVCSAPSAAWIGA